MGLFDALKKHKEQNPNKEISKSAVEIARLVDEGRFEEAVTKLNKGMLIYDNFAQIVTREMHLPQEKAMDATSTIMTRLTSKYMERSKQQFAEFNAREQQVMQEAYNSRGQVLHDVQSIINGQSSSIKR